MRGCLVRGFPARPPHLRVTLDAMVIRYSVQADSEAECAAGLRHLCSRLDVDTRLTPVYTLNSWIARTVLNGMPDDDEPVAEPRT